MDQFISEHGGVIVSGIVTIALLGIIMTVIKKNFKIEESNLEKILANVKKKFEF